jgi:16S rRNA (cytosine967-C5)-methyltransferase
VTQFTFAIAERVIRAASRQHPADSVLRVELKSHRGLSAGQTARISHTVFAYYRWRGWLAGSEPSRAQIERAVELAERFSQAPGSLSDADLVSKAAPAWLSEHMEVTPAWVRALQTAPKLWLRARRGQGRDLALKLAGCRSFGAGSLADVVEYSGGQDLFRTAAFHAGEFEIQDLHSQTVGWICNPQPGEAWWDACAGEGGKTLHLSELMDNKGLIWASDRSAWRLQRLKRRAGRAKVFNYRTAPWEGGPRLPTKTKFDGVLLDAPCSGVGTWHRNPHARWTTTGQDVKELSSLQKQLLQHAAAAVKPGGKLVYAVCTLTREETVEVVEAFEKASPQFVAAPVANPLLAGGSPSATLLLPQTFGGNGMFVAAWVRR